MYTPIHEHQFLYKFPNILKQGFKIINGSYEFREGTGLMFATLQINHFLPQEVAREARVSF